MRFEYFATPTSQTQVHTKKAEHEQECWTELPRCMELEQASDRQCSLAKGHPAGEQFDWFTDYNGHIWEK